MRYCSNCGKELNETESFCSNCGQPVGNTSEAITKSNKKSKKKKVLTALLIVFILVFVIPMIIGFAAAVFSDDTDTADENSAVTSDYSEASEGSGGVSQNDGWIYYESGLLNSVESSSNIYYVYDMSADDFISKVNENFEKMADQQGVSDADANQSEFEYNDKLENNMDQNVITYTYTLNGNNILGFYIDTIDSKIFQIRPVINTDSYIDNGYSVDDIYGHFSLLNMLALSALDVIDIKTNQQTYTNIYENLQNGVSRFYKSGILFYLSTTDNSSVITFQMIRVTDEQWNTMKQQAEGADVAYVEL